MKEVDIRGFDLNGLERGTNDMVLTYAGERHAVRVEIDRFRAWVRVFEGERVVNSEEVGNYSLDARETWMHPGERRFPRLNETFFKGIGELHKAEGTMRRILSQGVEY